VAYQHVILQTRQLIGGDDFVHASKETMKIINFKKTSRGYGIVENSVAVDLHHLRDDGVEYANPVE
jgi:hypothetical protein